MTDAHESSWSPTGKNLATITALLPISVFSILNTSCRSLAAIIAAVASCVVFEAVIQKLLKQKIQIKDLSAAASGIIIALLLPQTAAIWHIVLGSLVAMVVAKAFFGGNGSYVFSPALIARAFLYVSFKPAFADEKWLFPCSANLQGTAVVILLALAFVYLVVVKVIDSHAPAAFIAVLFALYAAYFAVQGADILSETAAAMTGGGILFAAVFLITDQTILPDSRCGKLIFGAGAALLTFIITLPGKTQDGVMFGILIMNAAAPYLNRKAAPKPAAGGAK